MIKYSHAASIYPKAKKRWTFCHFDNALSSFYLCCFENTFPKRTVASHHLNVVEDNIFHLTLCFFFLYTFTHKWGQSRTFASVF